MGLKPGPKPIAKSTGKPDQRRRDNKDTPGNTPVLKHWEVIVQGYGGFIYTLISSNQSALARLVPRADVADITMC
ncbi:TPA: hypothetical protein NPP16_003793 [Klebsiella pneumoniae]|uniref:hypothetical protein n=1 Tax=Klebsiella TaxID=570 RepID=UPI000945B03D|nr:hypothetical protein [Klebsiella pneumoniae]HBQ5781454.1 hypothetical protein [Klebsiella pneumoniae subsp. pneumoniae]EKV8547068.1 hypothetical protein [Klebsiella pneumoniae]EKV8551728.1 hypothetical protein [Klebsiella pneumoniae]EMA8138779.1 hypothetical protein [Klebsiella pneumoniae]KAB7961467.1 hypothetical protein GCL04_23215 [Klebsiella pneumoniae]